MKNFKRILAKDYWIILVILGIIGWFYWFQLRPSIIYSTCHEQAILSIEKPRGDLGHIVNKMFDEIQKKSLPSGNYELYYKACLRSKGIDK